MLNESVIYYFSYSDDSWGDFFKDILRTISLFMNKFTSTFKPYNSIDDLYTDLLIFVYGIYNILVSLCLIVIYPIFLSNYLYDDSVAIFETPFGTSKSPKGTKIVDKYACGSPGRPAYARYDTTRCHNFTSTNDLSTVLWALYFAFGKTSGTTVYQGLSASLLRRFLGRQRMRLNHRSCWREMIKGFFNYLFLFPLYSLLSLITGISKILISYYVLFFKIPFRGLILTPIAKIVDFLKTYKENKIQKSLHQWKENRHDTEKKSLALIKKKDFAATDEYQNTDDIVSVITSFLSIEDLLKVKGTSIQFYSVCHKDLASREIQYAYIIGARPIYTSIFFNFLHRKTITKEELLHSFNSCRIFYTSKLNDAEIEIYKR